MKRLNFDEPDVSRDVMTYNDSDANQLVSVLQIHEDALRKQVSPLKDGLKITQIAAVDQCSVVHEADNEGSLASRSVTPDTVPRPNELTNMTGTNKVESS